MQMVKVKDGKVIQIGLPKTGILKDGCSVSGYDKLPISTLLAEGWLPYEESMPSFDEATQHLEFTGYTITPAKVTANYQAVDNSVVIQEPTTEDRLNAIEALLLEII